MEGNKNPVKSKVRIAIVGCLHGHLKDLYDDIKFQDEKEGKTTDLVLCCGDFQSIRTEKDLQYISCPDKYKNMGQFHQYYSRKLEVPYQTIFIGGNHEASNVLEENYYGGYILNKIFYLGRSGLIRYKGITIGGLSGIFKSNDYFKGHYEEDLIKCLKSIYHTREFEIAKLSNIEKEIDIFLSHDWPTSVVNPNDFNRILKIKSFWADELYSNTLGSPVSFYLLNLLRPTYWFSGHMHFTYENSIIFEDSKYDKGDRTPKETNFYGLDKPVQRRKYFTIIEYTPKNLDYINDDNIYFDNEWLGILKTFNEYFPTNNANYDFSDFMKNKNEYLNLLNQYNLTSFNNSNKQKITPNKFFLKLQENINNFDNDIKWEYDENKNQRDFILDLLKIEDIHKTKGKENKNDFLYDKLNVVSEKTNKNVDEIDIEFV